MYNIYSNSELHFGRGSRKDITKLLETYNVKNVFLIIGKNAVAHGIFDMIDPLIDKDKYEVRIFNNIKPNPSIKNVLEGLETIEGFNPDIIITVGGGSVIDTAKAIALALTNPEKNNDIRLLSGINATNNRCLPIIAVPTTCGTGTEVTQFFIITDEQNKQKMVCADVNSFPIIAIVDSELMDGMPMNLASSTGMDALTHSIEAYTSNSTNAITDMYALKSIKGIFENAEKAIVNKEEEAKEEMALSQYLAGFSFANAGLGLVHAMAHQLGGVYDLPHGLCNALLLPHVIKYNGRFCGKRYKNILKEIGMDVSSITNEEATDILASKIVELNEKLEITKTLGELGVKKEDLEMLAEKALKDPCIGYNIVKPTVDEIIDIYTRSL